MSHGLLSKLLAIITRTAGWELNVAMSSQGERDSNLSKAPCYATEALKFGKSDENDTDSDESQ